MFRTFIIALVVVAFGSLSNRSASAQGGLRESLELLDRNENDIIEPEEITPLARPYLERIARAHRVSLDRPNPIGKYQEAARVYYAKQNGVRGEDVDPDEERNVRSFRPRDDDPIVPEFGLAEVKYRYEQRDLEEADDTIRRWVRDRDGSLDFREVQRARWTHRDPFSSDLNGDQRLSRLELAQRYARRRMLQDEAGELMRKAWRTGGEIRWPGRDDEDENRRGRDDWWRRGGDKYWLTASILSRFDRNRNGRLEATETTELGFATGPVDANRDGELSREELFAYTKGLQDQTGDLTDGLPSWFYELDENRDQQITLVEFATEEMTDARVAEFVALDGNDDGMLTATEILNAKSMTGGTFENNEAEVLPPRKTIVSEINVGEKFVIADLNVRINITHTHVSQLDGYLTSPDGQRIELFTAVGGHDDHFNGTVFDDQGRTPITKARPPFEGTFQPEGLAKRQPGLGVFNGKSIEGVWQLTIRCSNSERFGMLHSWALMARPDEDSLLGMNQAAYTPATPDIEPEMVGVEVADSRESFSETESSKRASAEFWTAERKAEYKARFSKPTKDEDWNKLSDEEKRQRLQDRKREIAEYKRMVEERSGKGPK
ncbi:MAG: proprotein convertase P-domain-containing protein [Planctomycetota bacterium]